MTTRDRPATIEVDENVQAVAAYMVASVPAARLVAVARAIGEMAPLLWGQYPQEQISALRLAWAPINPCEPQTRSGAIGLAPDQLRVCDGSGAGTS